MLLSRQKSAGVLLFYNIIILQEEMHLLRHRTGYSILLYNKHTDNYLYITCIIIIILTHIINFFIGNKLVSTARP